MHGAMKVTRLTLFFPSDLTHSHTHTTLNSLLVSVCKLPQATLHVTTLQGSHVQLLSDLPYVPTAASKKVLQLQTETYV